jgi:hypothetical protein
MTYIVIGTGDNPTVEIMREVPTMALVRQELDGESAAPSKAYATGCVGWVADDGFRQGLPRNIVGALLMTSIGTKPRPLVGKVVVTRYDHHGYPADMSGDQLDAVMGICVSILDALSFEVPAGLAKWRADDLNDEDWFQHVRQADAGIRAMPDPQLTVTFIPGDGSPGPKVIVMGSED